MASSALAAHDFRTAGAPDRLTLTSTMLRVFFGAAPKFLKDPLPPSSFFPPLSVSEKYICAWKWGYSLLFPSSYKSAKNKIKAREIAQKHTWFSHLHRLFWSAFVWVPKEPDWHGFLRRMRLTFEEESLASWKPLIGRLKLPLTSGTFKIQVCSKAGAIYKVWTIETVIIIVMSRNVH